jgi:eukaryotic-like serine/threonine-protein kinase
MVGIDRDHDRLIVSDGPSDLHKVGTWCGLAFALMVGVALIARPAGAAWQALGIVLASVPLLVLLRSWITTEHRFDRAAGLLIVGETGLARTGRRREVPIAAVAAVVDRRSRRARAIELVLHDRTPLVIARVRNAQAHVLDAVAREIAKFLGKRVELAQGAILADRFEIERVIGQGGMGIVYRAIDRTTNVRVALKLIAPMVDESERDERFAREIRLLSELDHPRVAHYVAHGTTSDGQAFLAMQWLEGEDLACALAEGPMSLGDSLRVLRGASEAVAAVHAKGIIHRDLKPSNLFLRGGSASDVVLLDFGVARGEQAATVLTSPAALVGTPFYMAPEQVSSARNIHAAADVFSLGCIFYECLTGTRPFEAPQLLGVLARILHDSPPPVRSLCPNVPEAWNLLLERMLDKRSDRRPADGAALLAELAVLPRVDDATLSETRAERAVVSSERSSSDQVLVCVVLASVANGASVADANADGLDSIRSTFQRFGCPLERLADGSLLATVLPKPSATDQVRVAARCALHLRERLPEARIAVATGRAPLGPSRHVGEAVDRAARLLVAAGAGDGIRLDDVSRRLLDGRFVTVVQGEESLLVGEQPDLDESRPLLGKPTPCVGREIELIQLEGIMSSAVEENAPQAAVVVAPPGFGKSRLRHELLRRLGERHPKSTLLVGYGDPLSAGSPYVLLGDALRRHAGIGVGDEPERAQRLVTKVLCKHVPTGMRQRVSEFLGELAGVPFPAEKSAPLRAARGDHRVMSEQIALAFQDFIAAECAAHAVVLVLEDLQWGDALTLKLLEGALRDLEDGALFVLALGRPEVEETFPKFFGDKRGVSLALRPLSAKASELLTRRVLGDGPNAEAVERIVRLSAGNALLLEELIRAAAEGRAGDVPETVLAMLQARLSRLSPDARLVLRAGSILGETFWRTGVRYIYRAWEEARDAEQSLDGLVESEVLVKLRVSRFPGDTEYAFRHALVCDAANGLLTDSDRRSGHLAAADWLESKGESDAVVLARHAEQGGDLPRAVSYYAHAARQSLEGYDFESALVRSSKGIACGAEGQELGVLRSIEASANYSKGEWKEAAELGLSALERLPRAGSHWCSTAEILMQVLPNVNDFATYATLSDDMLTIRPDAEARPAYLRALCTQLLGHAVAGAHERGQRCVDLIDELVHVESERDLVARGYSRLWRGIFANILSVDIPSALALVDSALEDLAESQVMHRLALSHIVRSFCLWGLGRHAESEQAARRGREIAREIHDDYNVALADWYLGLVLTESQKAESLDEADQCVHTMRELDKSAAFQGTSLCLSSRVAVAKCDWARAVDHGRQGRQGLAGLAPYSLFASTSLIRGLGEIGQREAAAAIAREDLARYRALAGAVCSEVGFLVTAAEAFRAADSRAEADVALELALRQIDRRAEKLEVGAPRATFLETSVNRRAFELRRAWLATAAG